jgi:hypothetical protein
LELNPKNENSFYSSKARDFLLTQLSDRKRIKTAIELFYDIPPMGQVTTKFIVMKLIVTSYSIPRKSTNISSRDERYLIRIRSRKSLYVKDVQIIE